MTASTTFKDWIRDEVAPLLKERGFARVGLAFRTCIGNNIALIHIQKSVKSSATEVKFTATAGVWSRRIAAFLENSTDSMPAIEECHWTQRFGELVSFGDDYWWALHARQNDLECLARFADVLVRRAIPLVQAMASDEALRDLWLTGRGPGLTGIQRLTYLSILLREIGPASALPTVIDQLNERSRGKPVRANVESHLMRLISVAGNDDSAS